MHTFMKEAEGISREMAKIILTQKGDVHDQASISNRISDITNFCDQKHFDEQIFGAEQKFYLKYDSKNKQTLIESILDQICSKKGRQQLK